jgi:hypothetical protein
VSVGGKVDGCGKKQVTPYMHCLVYHVPNFMKKHGGVKKFTGKGNIFHICLNSLTNLEQVLYIISISFH